MRLIEILLGAAKLHGISGHEAVWDIQADDVPA